MSRFARRTSSAANSRRLTAPGASPSDSRISPLSPGAVSSRLFDHGIAFCFSVALLVLSFAASARAETPLYEEEPYDQITLDAANDNAVLKIKPLDAAGHTGSADSAQAEESRQADRPQNRRARQGVRGCVAVDRQAGVVRAVGPEQGQRTGRRWQVRRGLRLLRLSRTEQAVHARAGQGDGRLSLRGGEGRPPQAAIR